MAPGLGGQAGAAGAVSAVIKHLGRSLECLPNEIGFTLRCNRLVRVRRVRPKISDNLVKIRIFPFLWIPATGSVRTGSAGMTIIQLISDRYQSCHAREGGYPVFKTTIYETISNC